MSLSETWEQHALDWIAWARTSKHDGFWEGTWPELQAVLPEPDGIAIDLGCGEGRLGRELRALGYNVVGLDRSLTLVSAAAASDPTARVLLADAAHVPLRDRCADLVVACMVLLDVDDLDAAIGEAHRVLSDWGVLCVAIVHPFASAQDPAGIDNNDPRFPDAYLTERRTEVRVERDGVGMTFVSAHRPLSRYADSLAAAGFAITALREFGDKVIPWLLVIRAERLPARHGPEGLVGRGLFIGVAPGGTSATSASV